MRQNRKRLTGIIVIVGFFALILDSKIAMQGASEGIELCIRTVIPSLFPFMILSSLLLSGLTGTEISLLSPIRKLCRMPKGAEPILLIGFLGGYPIGAQSICNAYTAGTFSKHDAQRMMGFCNNAGPAFLFGMVGQLFESKHTTVLLWLIHILSAIATGIVLPQSRGKETATVITKPITTGQAMQHSIRSMGSICGWVIIFRVILCFLNRWILWILPDQVQVAVSGILELSNGCIDLFSLQRRNIRYLFAAVFLALGGVCVLMQTWSTVNQVGLDLGAYLPGKMLQCAFSCILAVPAANLLFPTEKKIPFVVLVLPCCVVASVIYFLKKKENNSSIHSFAGV